MNYFEMKQAVKLVENEWNLRKYIKNNVNI